MKLFARLGLFIAACAWTQTASAATRVFDAGDRQRLYAGGPNANAVDAYAPFAPNPAPSTEITSGILAPTGMAVDSAGNLYVCNNGGQIHDKKNVFWTVTVYHRGAPTPFRTYVDGIFSPVGVTVALDGTVYVANLGSADVTVYPPNAVHPSRTLAPPSGGTPIGIALDRAGDAFVSYEINAGGVVYEYAPGSTVGKNVGITFGGNPHGLAVDAAGNLVVAISTAPNAGSSIDVFAPGATQPKAVFTGPFQPFMLAFDRSKRRLFVADYASGNNDGAIFVYAYPQGKLLYKDSQGKAAGAYGVALDPVAMP